MDRFVIGVAGGKILISLLLYKCHNPSWLGLLRL
jgi:hypothetical protein